MKKDYTVVPAGSYPIERNCAGCERKSTFVNTGCFRVNANGNRVDVWLVYQCEKCRHTYNLTIHERVRPASIREEYDRFLANDADLALRYGTDKSLFARNRAVIDAEALAYTLEGGDEESGDGVFTVHNPYELRVRTEKAAAQILGLTRSGVKKRLDGGGLEVSGAYLGRETVFRLHA